MKKMIQTHTFLLALTFALAATQINAQTMTGTIVTQPCNNNGHIAVTVSGLTPPINYIYTNWATNTTINHTSVSTLTDNLTGISAYQALNSNPWSNPNVWYVSATSGPNSANFSFTLTPPFTDSIDIKHAICPSVTGTLGAINFFGGTPPYAVVWTNTSTTSNYAANPAVVPTGIYTVSITDGAGCNVRSASGSSMTTIYVQSITNIFFNITGTPANCTNGTASVGVISGGTPPFTYSWTNSATTPTLSGLIQGFYSCVVTDVFGCSYTGGYYLPQAVLINYNATTTNATCIQNNGSILSFVSGGTAPYTFLWNNSATTQNLTGLLGGQSYQVQITDANGCIGSGGSYVSLNTPFILTYTA